MEKPVVAIFGATGGQGASVARALAEWGEFNLRGITRDVYTQHAQTIRNDVCTVIPCDPYEPNSVRSVLAGADAAFVNTVTDYSDPDCFEKEKQQGRLIAEACKTNGVRHVIYSSQLHTTRITGSIVRHMVAKAEVEDFMRELGLPLTTLIMPIYYEDFCSIFKPMTSDGCNFDLCLPTGFTPLDMMSVEDLGPIVLDVLRHPKKFIEKTISPSGDKLTMNEVAHVLSKHLAPKTFRDKQLTVAQFNELSHKLNVPGSTDWAQMFKFLMRQDQPHRMRDSRNQNPGLLSFEAWVVKNKDQIDRAMC